MSTRRTERPDDAADLLRALLIGERTPEEPEVRARLDADPVLRAAWEAERDLSLRLDAAGDLEDEVLAEAARHGAPAPGEEAVERQVAALARRRRGRPLPWRAAALPAAAALLVALGWMLRPVDQGGPAGPGDPDVILGGGAEAPELASPRGEVTPAALERFRWRFQPEAGWRGACRVGLRVDGSPIDWQPLVREHDLDGWWEWRPSSETVEALSRAASFEWLVESRPFGEEPVRSRPSSVSVSP